MPLFRSDGPQISNENHRFLQEDDQKDEEKEEKSVSADEELA